MESLTKRCWAEISLENITHNYNTLCSLLPASSSFLGVVKANAYGHGSVPVAHLLEKLGCRYLAVASIDEAAHLRNNGITSPILILGWTAPEFIPQLLDLKLTQTIGDLRSAEAYRNQLLACGGKLKIHVKLDTGMGRLGFDHQSETMTKWLKIISSPCFDAEGIFTHFAISDDPSSSFTDEQYNAFIIAVDYIEQNTGLHFLLKHCANSSAVLNYPQYALDMVRPGLALYGIDPECRDRGIDLRPAMTLKARIASINTRRAGETISYGRTHTLGADTAVAVATLGYADGLSRRLSNSFCARINGHDVQQIGRICMDMCMFDVSGTHCAPGDEITLFGKNACSVSELADICGTIPYELLCAVSDRVPRVYI